MVPGQDRSFAFNYVVDKDERTFVLSMYTIYIICLTCIVVWIIRSKTLIRLAADKDGRIGILFLAAALIYPFVVGFIKSVCIYSTYRLSNNNVCMKCFFKTRSISLSEHFIVTSMPLLLPRRTRNADKQYIVFWKPNRDTPSTGTTVYSTMLRGDNVIIPDTQEVREAIQHRLGMTIPSSPHILEHAKSKETHM